MSTLKNDPLAEVSKGKFRNVPCWCGSGKKIKKCGCVERMEAKADAANNAIMERAYEKVKNERGE